MSINCTAPSEPEETLMEAENGKAPGICSITAELLCNGGPTLISWLTNVICRAWDTEIIPDDWKKNIIFPFYKGKLSSAIGAALQSAHQRVLLVGD